jgi:hypothetical protein
MAQTIALEDFRSGLRFVLTEGFERVEGVFLDRGDSLFETLATLSAAEASQPLGPGSGNIAAKVNHIRFYLDAAIEANRTGEYKPLDWASSWRVGEVDAVEWEDLVERLRASYREILAFVDTFEGWDDRYIGGAFGIVAHTAYHLGEIRQALQVVKAGAPAASQTA